MNAQPQNSDYLESLLTELRRQPIKAVRRCANDYQNDDLLHEDCVASTIAFIVELIRDLDQNSSLRDEFWQEEIFDEDIRSIRKPIIGVARFILGAKAGDDARYERARSYAKIAGHFVDQAISPAQVRAKLIEVKPYAFLKQLKKQEAQESDDDNELAPPRRVDVNFRNAAGPAMPKESSREKDGTVSVKVEDVDKEIVGRPEIFLPNRPSKKPSARPKFDQGTMIMLEGKAFQNRVRNIGHGNAIWLKVTCEPLNEKWNRFLIIDVRPDTWGD